MPISRNVQLQSNYDTKLKLQPNCFRTRVVVNMQLVIFGTACFDVAGMGASQPLSVFDINLYPLLPTIYYLDIEGPRSLNLHLS